MDTVRNVGTVSPRAESIRCHFRQQLADHAATIVKLLKIDYPTQTVDLLELANAIKGVMSVVREAVVTWTKEAEASRHLLDLMDESVVRTPFNEALEAYTKNIKATLQILVDEVKDSQHMLKQADPESFVHSARILGREIAGVVKMTSIIDGARVKLHELKEEEKKEAQAEMEFQEELEKVFFKSAQVDWRLSAALKGPPPPPPSTLSNSFFSPPNSLPSTPAEDVKKDEGKAVVVEIKEKKENDDNSNSTRSKKKGAVRIVEPEGKGSPKLPRRQTTILERVTMVSDAEDGDGNDEEAKRRRHSSYFDVEVEEGKSLEDSAQEQIKKSGMAIQKIEQRIEKTTVIHLEPRQPDQSPAKKNEGEKVAEAPAPARRPKKTGHQSMFVKSSPREKEASKEERKELKQAGGGGGEGGEKKVVHKVTEEKVKRTRHQSLSPNEPPPAPSGKKKGQHSSSKNLGKDSKKRCIVM